MNCTPPEGPLDAESDIVGPGALAAFFATAAITYLTVIGAYITGMLDEDLLNPFDQRFIGGSRRILSYFKSKSQLLPRNASSTNAMNGENSSHTRQNAGKDAVSNFLVSLSDQQLVTGLAILIAAVSGQESLSTYDFYIAFSLGWFSCTTHLATINVLCVRFKRHPYIREVRVAGLMCAIALLSYAFVDAISVRDLTIPLHCPNNAADGIELFGISTIVVLCPIWFDYLTAVQILYLGNISLWDILDGAVLKVKGQEFRPLRKLRDLKAQEKTERVEYLVQKSNRFVPTRLGLLFYEGSFLATFPGITYSFSFGIAQIVALRWRRPLKLSDESTEMGFGQITALLLLILPFMSIGEAFISYRENRSSTAWMYDAVSIAKGSAEESHELQIVVGPQQDARARTAGSTAGIDSPRHQPLDQSSREAAGSQGERSCSENRARLGRNRSVISNSSREINHESAPVEFQTGYFQNIKGIGKRFPLELKALPSLGETPELINERDSLLRRYMLVKSAEETLSMRIPLIIFAFHVCLGILAASFLNSPDDRMLRAGILLILILVVLRFYEFPFRIWALVIKFLRTKV